MCAGRKLNYLISPAYDTRKRSVMKKNPNNEMYTTKLFTIRAEFTLIRQKWLIPH